ncbi:DegT/DnrJ/EryC1/StrS family aminotransferase [Chitinophaga sp. GCM10012297]|uniref:DegT/DnrJ/EryC1/StrS family aminotransferase n=1 Tax=Chitinophaga chungangae TaxID=2821488 RepID=A0ABS3YIL4_9BACT|nr:DegT/DnrJ/EryC1/StrS family aminotransferase [Chitinophaga chungangae]MBO9154507.1 DegT/DnrJ/EryC1/StrS family aminotransferase [Chitinophaga chungangae]
MANKDMGRRHFIGRLTAASVAGMIGPALQAFSAVPSKKAGVLAVLGGEPVRAAVKKWPKWPHVDDRMIEEVVKTTKSGIWSRIQSPVNGAVATFEKQFAAMTGAKHCIGTGSGTQALAICVEALGIGPGDEVITSPYTDFGTVSAILTSRALPVLADLDPASYQLDPADVERKITPRTKAIMPVHIMGLPADMDRIMAIATKHNLKVIEDACQGALAKYRGKALGTIGHLGCFSFQASKSIACGEGGAIVGNDDQLMDQCYTVHNHGTNRKGKHVTIGPKNRMNEFEAAILNGQLPTAADRFLLRNKNVAYLNSKLKGFAGLVPQKQYEGTESGGFYNWALSYKKEHFNNASRQQFLKAVAAEGIALSPYIPNGLHREAWIDHILELDEYKNIFPAERLKKFREDAAQMPGCDQVCAEMIVLPGSGPLIAGTADMDDIINAIMKVYENRDKLASL